MRRIWLLLLIVLLASACTQQQPASSTVSGTTVKVHISDDWGQPLVATVVYQAGDGEWQLAELEDFGEYSFTLPSGEKRYGVAVNCIPTVHGLQAIGFYTIYQLTTDDATEVSFSCFDFVSAPGTTTAQVTWDATAVAGDYFKAFTPIGEYAGSANPLEVTTTVGDDTPFLFLAYDGSDDFANLKGVLYEKLDVTPAAELTVSMILGDSAEFGTISGPATPAGFDDCFLQGTLYDGGGLYATELAEAGGDPCQGKFLRIPGLDAAADYVFISTYRDTGTDRALAELAVLPAAGLGQYQMSADLPDPWPATYSVTPAALPTFELDYPGDPVSGYMISYYGQNGGPWWMVYLSPDWLDGSSSYTLPDLTLLPGFGGAKPLRGETVGWEVFALFSNTPLGEVLNSRRWLLTGGAVWVPAPPGLRMTGASKAGAYAVP